MIRDPNKVRDRLYSRGMPVDGHWLWEGVENSWGYGQIWIDGKMRQTHRVAYELAYGSIPNGLQLDHLCRLRICFAPAHLEAVTARINILRGFGVAAVASRVTHCPRGHDYTPENTYKRPGREYYRDCRICRRARRVAYNEARRQARP